MRTTSVNFTFCSNWLERISERESFEKELKKYGFDYKIKEKKELFKSTFETEITYNGYKHVYIIQEIFNRFSPLGNVGRTKYLRQPV